ncbi:NAD-dependent epimerase/dehydratase family protein [Ochrovirga pacifica]|uniref:NAD-dependent epimerase/dehydratase family protein n=1 Tax=Ochrovirga pacifica TaxID=1042376 RepID=UPI0002559817|nr:NAD-dependent epimerase/dehydratase family protein [Ochrovirga pacifica]
MILVTGGTGLVGAHLLYHLCKKHKNIIAIYRSKASQKNTHHVFQLYGDTKNYKHIVWKKADIIDIPSLTPVFKDVTKVYHAAAMVSFHPKDAGAMRKVNIEGTANVVNLCLEFNISKLCFVSSIATLSKKPGVQWMDETSDWNPEEDHSDYSISKYGAEMEVWRGAQEGLPVAIVNPGVIFGFGMWHANTSNLFVKISKGFPFYTKGVTGVVAVEDVVKAMELLMESSLKNIRFVLVNQNLSFLQLFTLIANSLQATPPKLHAKKWLTELLWRINEVVSLLTFRTYYSALNKYSTRSSHQKSFYNGTLIKKSVAFNYTPFEHSIKTIASKLLKSNNS